MATLSRTWTKLYREKQFQIGELNRKEVATCSSVQWVKFLVMALPLKNLEFIPVWKIHTLRQLSREYSSDNFGFHESNTHSKRTLFHKGMVLSYCRISSVEDYTWHCMSSWKRSPLSGPRCIRASCIYVHQKTKKNEEPSHQWINL